MHIVKPVQRESAIIIMLIEDKQIKLQAVLPIVPIHQVLGQDEIKMKVLIPGVETAEDETEVQVQAQIHQTKAQDQMINTLLQETENQARVILM